MVEGNGIFDSRQYRRYVRIFQRKIGRFLIPCNRITNHLGCEIFGYCREFKRAQRIRRERYRSAQLHTSLRMYEINLIFDSRIYSFYNHVAVQFVSSPSAGVTSFFRNCRNSDFLVQYVVGLGIHRHTVSHEGYGVLRRGIYSVNGLVAAIQLVFFPSAVVIRLCRNCRHVDFLIEYRVGFRVNGYAVSHEGYRVFNSRVNCLDGYVTIEQIRSPSTRVMFLFGNSGFFDAGCAFLVGYNSNRFAVSDERCLVFLCRNGFRAKTGNVERKFKPFTSRSRASHTKCHQGSQE